MFARHAGIAIENARLHEQVQRLAVVEERERIGQDLHDGIIQSLYGVSLSLEDVPEFMDTDPPEARARIERGIDGIHLAIRDIRNFIFGLRPERLAEVGLVGGLAAVADEFRLNTVIDLELTADESLNAELPAEATIQLLQIAQRGVEQRRAPLRRDPGAGHAGPAARRRGRDRPRDRRQRGGLRPDDSGSFRRSSRAGQHARPGRRDRWRASRSSAGRSWARVSSSTFRVPDPRPRTDPGASRARHQPPRRNAGPPAAPGGRRRPRGRPPGPVLCLDRREAFQVVAEAGTRRRGAREARRFKPDIVIMDVRLPDGSGIEACREIRAELPGDAGRDADQLPRRGGRAVGDRRRRQRLPAQADPGARPRGRPGGRRAGRIAARPGGHREGPRAGPADRHRRRSTTSSPHSPSRSARS